MKPKIDIINIADLKEYFNTYLDPKKRISLSDELDYQNFLRSLHLKDDSIFLAFLKSLFRNFEYLKDNSENVNNSFVSWTQNYIKETKKVPKAYKKIFLSLNINESSVDSFLFCLETFFSVIMKIILVLTWYKNENSTHSIHYLLADLLSLSQDKKITPIAWLIFLKDKIENFKLVFQQIVFEEDIFDWWTINLTFFKILKLEELTNSDALTLNDSLANIILELVKYDFNSFHGDLIGDLYQDYFDKESRKALGEFYTPSDVVDYILDSVGYNTEEILSKRLVDLSCGSGSFLIQALKIYLANAEKNAVSGRKYYWSKTIRSLCSQYRIMGLDIHPFAVYMSHIHFIHTLIPYYRKALQEDNTFKIDNLPIFKTDSLMSRTFENIKENLIFDYVVGNPPYVNTRGINKDNKIIYESIYSTAKGSYDLYCLFIEKGVTLLNTGGKLGFITSNQFLTSDYGLYLRKYLRNGYDQTQLNINLEEFIDFRDSKIFQGVTAYPCIIVLSKSTNLNQLNNYKFLGVRIAKKIENVFEIIKGFKNSKRTELLTTEIDLFKMSSQYLGEDIWTIMPDSERKVFDSIINKSDALLGDITENIFVGTQTSLDKVYLVKISEAKNDTVTIRPVLANGPSLQIEKSMLKPILKGKDVAKWSLNWSNHWLVFPYDKSKKNQVIASKELQRSFPLTMKYFNHYSKEIKGREHGLMMKRSEWYAYIYPKNHELFEQPKLISQLLSKSNRFSFDEEGKFYFVAVGGNCITFKTEFSDNFSMLYLLGLLNSSVSTFMLKHWSPVHEGGFYLYIYNFIKRLPLVLNKNNANAQKELVNAVKSILEIKKLNQEDRDVVISDDIANREKHLNKLVYWIFNLSKASVEVLEKFNEKY